MSVRSLVAASSILAFNTDVDAIQLDVP